METATEVSYGSIKGCSNMNYQRSKENIYLERLKLENKTSWLTVAEGGLRKKLITLLTRHSTLGKSVSLRSLSGKFKWD